MLSRSWAGVAWAARAIAAVLLGMAAAGVGGCGATDQQTLVVELRRAADDAPEAGVPVRVTTLNPQHALRPSDYVRWLGGGPAADGPAVLTDEAGRASVLAPIDRPFLIQVLLPGLQPETVYVRENGAGNPVFQPADWHPLPPVTESGVPAGSPTSTGWRVRVRGHGPEAGG